MTDLSNEEIWERRFDVAIERFAGFDEYEYTEIPGYGVDPESPPTPILTDLEEYRENLKKRFEACKQRYQGMLEYMEIPDMDLWLKLKSEIIPKIPLLKLERDVCRTYYTLDGKDFYTFDEFQTASMAMNSRSDFDPNLDEFQTASMTMNSSNYIDDYESDYDNYSMDSIDKAERGYSRFKDKYLMGDRAGCHKYDDRLEDRFNN